MASSFFVQASEFLPDERLRELARCADLEAVHHLTFSVDTTENSLGDLGRRLRHINAHNALLSPRREHRRRQPLR